MNLLEEICCPISEFCENATTMVAKVRSNHRPIVVTQYGKPVAVLVSAESYQEILNRIHFIENIKDSEEDLASGGGIEQREFRNELKARFFPGD